MMMNARLLLAPTGLLRKPRRPPPERLLLRGMIRQGRCRMSSSSSSSATVAAAMMVSPKHRSHLIFGANTDVGKTVVTAGLVRASLSLEGDAGTYYVKPLQTGAGGSSSSSDQAFVERHAMLDYTTGRRTPPESTPHLIAQTLFEWSTPTSPHLASRGEKAPVSDEELLHALEQELDLIIGASSMSSMSSMSTSTTWIETAGGVLSPAAASPRNRRPHHACGTRSSSSSDDDGNDGDRDAASWGWRPQADVYQAIAGRCSSVVLVGDGRLGGISTTLSSLESLLVRGYDVAAIVLIDADDGGTDNNASALREYVGGRSVAVRGGSGEALLGSGGGSAGGGSDRLLQRSIVSLPPIPTDTSVPLDDWYLSDQVTQTFDRLDDHLLNLWHGQVADLRELVAQSASGRSRSDSGGVIWTPPSTASSSSELNGDTHKATPSLVDSAAGDYYHLLVEKDSGKQQQAAAPLERVSLFDAGVDTGSTTTAMLPHGDSSAALAIAAAAGRYGSVTGSSSELLHAPAIALAEALLGTSGPGRGWADRVMFVDSGSRAHEVSLRMALQLYQKRMRVSPEEASEIDFVICAQDGFRRNNISSLEDEHGTDLLLETPTLGYADGDGGFKVFFPDGLEPPPNEKAGHTFDRSFPSTDRALDVPARLLTSLFSHYKEMIEMRWLVHEHSMDCKIAAIVIGDGDSADDDATPPQWVDPLWQRALIDIAESRNVPVVYDETGSGTSHRIGSTTGWCELLNADPDIAACAVGGIAPFGAVLASDEVLKVFEALDEIEQVSLLHGHSNTAAATPVACVSAIHALDAYNAVAKADPSQQGNSISKSTAPRMMLFDVDQTRKLSELPLVEKSFALGSVLAVTVRPELQHDDGAGGDASSRADAIGHKLRRDYGICARARGSVLSLAVSPLTSREECARLADVLYKTIAALGKEM